ncbi:hypothetical protein ASD12_18230 [Mesorhizobium sp. Root102]|uniref:hypothetical protein n=1 Tax=Mesorhizobium sp. Root102 TaxID=1736422 RepID=UPI0006F79234|nr:hypothetical protein [Mesorhizobium sp. Root102]KQU77738.1 hypothetical protein ASD12_18230 [Mesorhizobium sp. Root102]
MLSPKLEEICDLIVEGKCHEAYEKARDYCPGLMTWEARARLIAARNAPQAGPFPSEAEIDARHDRAVASYKASVQANAAAAVVARAAR